MKDWQKKVIPTKEKLGITAKKKEEGVTNSNQTKGDAGKLKKKDEKGEDVMGMEEDFKLFMKEQERFNKSLGTFVEGLSKREERQADDHRIQEQIKTATAPIQEKVGQFGKVLEKLQKELEPFGEICTSVEECKKKLKKFEEVATAGEGKEKTLDDFSAQEKYDSIKKAPVALADLDNIYVARFAENPEYRKSALGKLSPETFIEMAKNKEIDDKLTGMCQDEACRIDIVKRIKEVEKSTGRKLL